MPSATPNASAYLRTNLQLHEWSKRDDVLVFDAEPAERPTDLAGPVRFEATLSTSGPSTDLFAKLLDVHPNGAAETIAHGRVHLREQETRVTLPLGHAGYRIRAGHRLRLHLHSSDFPEFVLHPGTSENAMLAVHTERTDQQIRLGGTAPALLAVRTLA